MSSEKHLNCTVNNSDKILISHYYQHYKGNIYYVFGFATHTETNETLVLYHRLGNANVVWARPTWLWFKPVSEGQPRFVLYGETKNDNQCKL